MEKVIKMSKAKKYITGRMSSGSQKYYLILLLFFISCSEGKIPFCKNRINIFDYQLNTPIEEITTSLDSTKIIYGSENSVNDIPSIFFDIDTTIDSLPLHYKYFLEFKNEYLSNINITVSGNKKQLQTFIENEINNCGYQRKSVADQNFYLFRHETSVMTATCTNAILQFDGSAISMLVIKKK